MKTNRLLSILLFSMVAVITACTNTHYPTQPNRNLLSENWIPNVNLNPMLWTRGADNWFFTGEPNQIERNANIAPVDKAMTIIAVKVPQFNDVTVNGCFQVQIIGGQDHNSVFILGANDAVRGTTVEVSGNKIYIAQNFDPNSNTTDFSHVIVRIGIQNLRHLQVSGGATVLGHSLLSDRLVIDSANYGNTLLSGRMNLVKVNNTGSGTISVLGAFTPCLYINSVGNGSVNVQGHVGIQSINHTGGGTVSVIGADSNALTVNASGGLTTVAGYVNLKKLTAINKSCVFIYWVNSNGVSITAGDNATVGLAGSAPVLDMNLLGDSRFLGQYLRTGTVYVKTQDNAHANITVNQRLFASTVDTSSIYFFGSPTVSRYTNGNGVIIPVWGGGTALPVPNAPTFWVMRGPTVSGHGVH